MLFDLSFFAETFLKVWKGAPVSFAIVAIALIFGLPLGFLIAIARFKRIKVGSQLSALYVSFIRGTPMIVQIYISYSLLPSLLNAFFVARGIEINIFDVPNILYAFVVFTLNTIAISSETFRASLVGVDKGQMEAAKSIGLTSFQAYVRIIIPQALVSALPNLCNITVNLFKGTSLVFIMGVMDITAIAKTEAGINFAYVEAYLDIFLVYLVLCMIIDYLFKYAERRLKRYKMATV